LQKDEIRLEFLNANDERKLSFEAFKVELLLNIKKEIEVGKTIVMGVIMELCQTLKLTQCKKVL
jgi:hypothetical protein